MKREDPQLYEHVSLIVMQYEQAAIRTKQRSAVMTALHSPLSAMQYLLHGSQTVLEDYLPENLPRPPRGEAPVDTSDAEAESRDDSEQRWSDAIPNIVVNENGEMNVTEYLSELTGLTDVTLHLNGEDVPLLNYLEDCLKCDLRVYYRFQINPVDLMGPIIDMVDEIEDTVRVLEPRLDNLNVMRQICFALNTLKSFCVADIVSMLMSLNLLLSNYLTLSINVKVDWTVLLAPILQVVVELVGSLVTSVTGVLLAPLDCSLGALSTARSLEREVRETIQNVRAMGDQIADLGRLKDPDNGFDIDFILQNKRMSATSGSGPSVFPDTPDFPNFTAHNVPLGKPKDPSRKSLDVFSGFDATLKRDLADALRDPNFINASVLDKIIVSVSEAVQFLRELESKVRTSLNSLRSLTTGGLNIQVQNLGIILFLLDMIALIRTIVRLLSSNRNVSDWCSFLEENPQTLLDAMQSELSVTGVQSSEGVLTLINGPNVIGTIPTCLDKDDSGIQNIISDWIAEINGLTPSSSGNGGAGT